MLGGAHLPQLMDDYLEQLRRSLEIDLGVRSSNLPQSPEAPARLSLMITRQELRIGLWGLHRSTGDHSQVAFEVPPERSIAARPLQDLEYLQCLTNRPVVWKT